MTLEDGYNMLEGIIIGVALALIPTLSPFLFYFFALILLAEGVYQATDWEGKV